MNQFTLWNDEKCIWGWFAFNREYVPLGWNSTTNSESIYEQNPYAKYPIHTKFKGLTDKAILKIITDVDAIIRNEVGEIESIFLYNDRTNPQSHPEFWNEYFEKIKAFSKFEIVKLSRADKQYY